MKTLLAYFSRSVVFFATLMMLFLLADSISPLAMTLESQKKFARVIVAQDGTPLRAFADKQGVWRYPVTLDEVSPRYIDTLVAYEDRWFWYHPGINPMSMLRAVFQNIYNGRVISGGSTLTMQVARILDPHHRTVTGKLKQMFRALQLEWHLDKAEILTLYLNLAPFGGPIEGVQAASYAYLSKPAKELSQAEAALLSVLPQSPSRFRPDRHPERATRARNKVLERLHNFGYLTRDQVNDARLEVIVPQLEAMPMSAPILARRLKDKVAQGGVLKTTINAQLQTHLESLALDYSRQLPDKSSVAILVVNHHNMSVKSYVASADFQDNERYGQVDMIKAIRSPGSTLKPFLYAMAIDQGLIASHSMLMDEAVNIDGYEPTNFSERFAGAVSMSDALQRSLNVPAVQVLQFLGPGFFHNQLENAGLKLYLPENTDANLSMILGGTGTQLEQLVSAYTAFSRKGKAGQLRFVFEPDNLMQIKERYLMSPGSAWIIRSILSELQYREPLSFITHHGTSLAWKTGTSYGFRDAWAIGMTDDYTIGIWTGRPDGTPVPGHYGAQTAVPLLQMVTRNLPPVMSNNIESGVDLKRPESVSREVICWTGGGLQSMTAPEQCHKTQTSWILNDTVPPVLPSDPAIETALNDIQIVSVDDGSKIKRPEGAIQPLSISLEAKGGRGANYWFINGQPVNKKPTRSILSYTFKQSGVFKITVMDEHGLSDHVTLYVN